MTSLARQIFLGRRRSATLAELFSPWWERFPERLEYELRGLARAGIRYERDENALSQGILRLHLEIDLEAEAIALIATYPDLYPYFRFEVMAPELSLDYHQNPFAKNLCLIGRGTHNWQTNDTLAELLESQLPGVLQAARAESVAELQHNEQRQAEPFTDFLPYARPSMIVLGDEWQIPQKYECGTLKIATSGSQGPPPERFVRGTVQSIAARTGKALGETPLVREAFPDQVLGGSWLRLREESLPRDEDALKSFVDLLYREYPYSNTAPWNAIDGGHIRILGILAPEEVEWRGRRGDGWFFICLFQASS